jgi:chromate transport protein ChrA
MTELAHQQELGQTVRLAALFNAFLAVSLCGVGGGGGIVWARRIAVESRRWISDREFADIVSLCQFMPGPNIVGIAVCVGAKMRGAIGTIAALCGFLSSHGPSASRSACFVSNMLICPFSGISLGELPGRQPGF